MGLSVWSLFCNSVLTVLSSFAIISLKSCFILCFCNQLTVSVLCLFLVAPWVGLWYVIMAFPDHTHLHLDAVILAAIYMICMNHFSCYNILSTALLFKLTDM